MSLIGVRIAEVVKTKWSDRFGECLIYVDLTVLKKEHTYIMIFNKSSPRQLTALKECQQINIIYETDWCWNNHRWHYDEGSPDIKLVIFELAEVPETNESKT